jgi:G3E family GTPase
MDTSRILPPGRSEPTPEDVANLPVSALLLACLDPRFKRRTGWLGLSRCPGNGDAWTCRLRQRHGIFGWLPHYRGETAAACEAVFALHYFPTPDDPLFDRFSLAAGWAVLQDDFRTRVRDFANQPDLAPAFVLGRAILVATRRPRAFLFRFEALTRDAILFPAGLRGEDGWVVRPGEAEQDLPAWTLGRELFDVVAGALTFGLGCPPAVLVQSEAPGWRRLRLPDGTVRKEPAETPLLGAGLAWGEAVTGRERDLRLPDACTERTWLAGGCLPPEEARAPCWQAHALESADIPAAPETADHRPGLIVLTGFLGSGKTSLLLEMLEHHRAHDQFVAIIQNEIGATGVDGYLVDGGESALTLDEGCVCCSLAGSLSSGIRRLTERFRPERIILETSGLANPLNLLQDQASWSELARLEMIVTVVDAVHAPEMLRTSDIARDQVRGGDVLVVNKIDRIDPTTVERLDACLRQYNPTAPLLHTHHGQLQPGILFDAGTSAGEASRHCPPPLLLHRHNHEDEAFNAVRLPQPETLTRQALARWLEKLPPDVFRLKGILRLADVPVPLVLQGVGRRWEVHPLDGPFEDDPFLVFIGRQLASESLRP